MTKRENIIIHWALTALIAKFDFGEIDCPALVTSEKANLLFQEIKAARAEARKRIESELGREAADVDLVVTA